MWVEVGTGGELVGFIAFGGGELLHLYVAPGCQGKGTAPDSWGCPRSGASQLELWVFRRNEPARTFYGRHGFQPVRETEGVGNEEREPDVRLRWEPPAG